MCIMQNVNTFLYITNFSSNLITDPDSYSICVCMSLVKYFLCQTESYSL